MPDIVTLGLRLADITPNTCKLSESGCYILYEVEHGENVGQPNS
jgi:hypothetical protein